MPISYHVVGSIVQLFLVMLIRFAYRFWVLMSARITVPSGGLKGAARRAAVSGTVGAADGDMGALSGFHIPRVMLVGAGDAGRLILRDIQTAPEVQEQVVCIIDDDRNTWRRFMDGVQIVGGREMIPEAVEKYQVDKIYVTIPSASMQTRKEILEICAQTDCEIKNLPGVFQLVSGDVIAGAYIPTGHTFLDGTCAFDKAPLLQIVERIQTPKKVCIPKTRKNPLANISPAFRSRIGVKLIKDSRCDHCGICEKECPMGAIRNGKTGSACIRCLRCVTNCPQKALQYKNSWILDLYLKSYCLDDSVLYL
jgi:ferredoxin